MKERVCLLFSLLWQELLDNWLFSILNGCVVMLSDLPIFLEVYHTCIDTFNSLWCTYTLNKCYFKKQFFLSIAFSDTCNHLNDFWHQKFFWCFYIIKIPLGNLSHSWPISIIQALKWWRFQRKWWRYNSICNDYYDIIEHITFNGALKYRVYVDTL